MRQSLTLITLGVSDLAAARRFYVDGLGFKPSAAGNEHISFFNMGGLLLSLYDRAALAEDAHLDPAGSGFRGFTLAMNLASRAEVDQAFEVARAAGARILKAPVEVFWGGYSGYFADPDGNAWEIAHNPFWGVDEAGRVILPD